jgi:hypothetical protein
VELLDEPPVVSATVELLSSSGAPEVVVDVVVSVGAGLVSPVTVGIIVVGSTPVPELELLRRFRFGLRSSSRVSALGAGGDHQGPAERDVQRSGALHFYLAEMVGCLQKTVNARHRAERVR